MNEKKLIDRILEQEKEDQIFYFLNEIGFSFKWLGYAYMEEAIQLLMQDKTLFKGVNNRLYKIIADEWSVSNASVEKALRRAIEKTLNKIDSNNLQEVFGITQTVIPKNLSNKKFLERVVKYLEPIA